MPIEHATTYRFNVAQFERLVELVFKPGAPVELIHGQVMDVPAGSSRAWCCIANLRHLLESAVDTGTCVSVHRRVKLSSDSEVRPALLVGRCAGSDPEPASADDVLLSVEVADAQPELDRIIKTQLYGTTGIPECWLVDLASRQVTVLRGPSEAGFLERRDYRCGEEWKSPALNGKAVPVDSVFIDCS